MTNSDLSPKPYRVERRLHIGQPWMLVAEAFSHDEARRVMMASVEQWEGFARVVVQHVIERVDAGHLPRPKPRRARAGVG